MRLFGLFLGFYIAWWSGGPVTAKQDGTPPPPPGMPAGGQEETYTFLELMLTRIRDTVSQERRLERFGIERLHVRKALERARAEGA